MRERAYLASRSILSIGLQKMTNKVLCIITDILPVPLMENDSRITALIDQILQILTSERRITAEKRVGDDAKRPHINGLSVTLLQHHFWGCVAEGASHCSENFVFGVKHLCDTEISKHEIRVRVACEIEEVFGLKI